MKPLIFALTISILLLNFDALSQQRGKKLDYHLKYTCIINDIPKDAKKVRIWIPYPRSDFYQEIHGIRVHSHYPTYILEEKEYGNNFLYLEVENPEYGYIDVNLDIFASRYQRLTKVDFKRVKEPDDQVLAQFDKYFRDNWDETADYEKLKKITRKILRGKRSYMKKVRALYDYVYENMEYSKEIPGYGSGDVERACRVKSGNCIDFHSLFVALANVSEVISREVAYIDIPLEGSDIPNYCRASYHCAVEIYLPGLDIWFPLDISHAKKGRGPKEFYFGSLDNLRLRLGHGRNILLPGSNIRIKRILTEPFVLVDGKPHTDVSVYVVANIYDDATKIYGNVIHPGEKAGPFKAKDIKGSLFDLEEYLGKKYILLNFFTTWCGRCQWESEGLNRVYAEYKDKFVFVRINVMEEREKVVKFAEKYRIPFPVIPDERTEISRLYGVKYVPANIIIGLDGKVKFTGGLLPERDLRRRVKEVLNEF